VSAVARPRSRERRSTLGNGCLYGFFAIFALAGLAAFIPFFGIPALRALQSRGWPAVPCTIVSSQVGVHADSDGDTYSVDVVYEYASAGRTLRSERYGFLDASSSGRTGKEEAVAALPAGTRTVCYVDPDDPTFAVLDRSLFPWLLFGCLPLIFTAVGVGGIGWLALTARRLRQPFAMRPGVAGTHAAVAGSGDVEATAKAPPWMTDAGLEAWAPHGPTVLEPAGKRLGKFFGMLAVTLIWNGIVGAFAWAQWREGDLFAGGCAAIATLVFAAIGLLLLASVPHQALALANPRPILDLSGALHVGGKVTLGWRFQGSAGRIHRLRILLEGVEVAIFRQGTTTSTQRRVFATLPVVDTTHPATIAQGSVELVVPETMHSFGADHNKVVWSLHVKGEIARWPDVDDQLQVGVYPAEAV
jgi:hypothetical protein